MTKKPERYFAHAQFIRAFPPPFNSYTEQKFLNAGRKGDKIRYVRGGDGAALFAESDLVCFAREWLFRHKPELADQFAAALAKLPSNS